MKWLIFVLGLLTAALLPAPLSAQEAASQGEPPANSADLPNWDIDSLFNEAPPPAPDDKTKTDQTNTDQTSTEETNAETTGFTAKDLVKQRGFTFNAAYEFAAGVAPGWYDAPWIKNNSSEFYFYRLFKMRGTMSLDAQITNNFRTKTTAYFEVPNLSLNLQEFFFDYSLYDRIFVRGGKYDLSWGISPNYNFTNLLSRIPADSYGGDSYILKADVPAGIGGFQVLALTRADIIHGTTIKSGDIAYGGKYNLAVRSFDMDTGAFYQEEMPLRWFMSLKTTIGITELYSEGLCAINFDEQPPSLSGAANLGCTRDFFDGRLSTNGELFYNAEKNAFWYRPETTLRAAEITPFIDGLNVAVNLLYRFKVKADPRFFIQARYSPLQNSAQFIPGFRLNPWSNVEFYFAVPMALGNKDGYYYNNTFITDTANNKPVPFCVMFLVTLKGDMQFGYYPDKF